MVARGLMLGPTQQVILHLLDITPAAEALQGVRLELLDAAFPLLAGQHRARDESYSIMMRLHVCNIYIRYIYQEEEDAK